MLVALANKLILSKILRPGLYLMSVNLYISTQTFKNNWLSMKLCSYKYNFCRFHSTVYIPIKSTVFDKYNLVKILSYRNAVKFILSTMYFTTILTQFNILCSCLNKYWQSLWFVFRVLPKWKNYSISGEYMKLTCLHDSVMACR